MGQKKNLSILEYSRLTGIKRDNLRFYDRIGLLKPEIRGENGYRYYTRRQLSSAYLISGLRLLGVGLEDIRHYSAERTPEKMLGLFAEQEAKIQAEIKKLQETSEILKLYADMAREGLRHTEGELTLEQREAEPIFLCPLPPASSSEDEAEIYAYESAGEQGVNLGYPMGVKIAMKDLICPGESPVYQYYLKAKTTPNTVKPAGLYAVAYGRSNLLEAMDVFERLIQFIDDQGLVIAGDAYGEFLLDDLAVLEPAQQFGRIEIQVRQADPSE